MGHPASLRMTTLGNGLRDSVQEAFGYAFVGVDAAVAEEGPVLAGDFDEFGVEVGD